ncbi:alpha/beta hydrolase [Bosea sp. NBC_00550]|uniref:alpha/beta hydrolase n=1 Tax=Bosea sp. NBC_00550 TaxID=2969621 RepID=UPI0022321704|nr:alpha/beta-hydrolase family protein [Bosea sp. NBC_00550]UZF94171.1 alpha/beta-hydrolase family protein [Bosea sp. NBC_00550]
MTRWIRRQLSSLSGVGLVLGTLLFAAALTPTLVPRSYLTQGALAGICFAIGYGLGVLSRQLWRYLELPKPSDRLRRPTNAVALLLSLLIALLFLWKAAEWQNSVRAVFDLPHLPSSHPTKLCFVAFATFALALVIARLFKRLAGWLVGIIRRFIPPRLATAIGIGLAALLFWSLASNVLASAVFRVLDSSYRELDARLEPERAQPTDPKKTGSPASLVSWRELGRAGREFIAAGPSAERIGTQTGHPAQEPIRVYVGLQGAETPEARAKLALEELKRVGGFARSTLIVVTPTGTGWVDPSAMNALEYLRDGDVASVAVQYSYLSSPLSLLTQPEYGAETARALFREIYRHWTALPHDARPKLYLHGLSLGAMNSEKSAELFEMIGDPIDGALWSGPPFETPGWRSITEARNPGTPQWLPEFRDGRVVRFMNQNGPTVPADRPWGPMRLVYLQYASDPIVFFDYRDAYRQPAWMQSPRGPDVSSELRWYPVVTMLQLALDMAVATSTPMGYGHVYAPEHYVEGWTAVLGTGRWSAEKLAALKQHLAAQARAPAGTDASKDNAYDNRGG